RLPQRLVGVDVADARDHALVEQERLHRRPPAGEVAAEPARRPLLRERLRPRPRTQVVLEPAGSDEPPCPEPALVGVDERRPVVETEDGADVRQLLAVLGAVVKPARHPQVDDERPARVEPEEQVLAAPAHAGERLAEKLGADDDRVLRRGEAAVHDVGLLDGPPAKQRVEAAPDGFDLRQLRHGPDSSYRHCRGCARRAGQTTDMPGRPSGPAPVSTRSAVAPTSANVSPSWRWPRSGAPGTCATRRPCSREWSVDGVVGSQPWSEVRTRRSPCRMAARIPGRPASNSSRASANPRGSLRWPHSMSVSTRFVNTRLPSATDRISSSMVAIPWAFDVVGWLVSMSWPAKMSPIFPTPCTVMPRSRSCWRWFGRGGSSEKSCRLG